MKIAQTSTKIWAIVPAAGSGSRFSKTALKQYQMIESNTVLEHTVNAILSLSRIEGCVLAVSPNDTHIQSQKFKKQDKVHFCFGGQERVHSVLNALYYLRKFSVETDYVLVHDAARPCISSDSLKALTEYVSKHKVSAILATPVRDTLKRACNLEITQTVDRTDLWQAQTPQMAQIGHLIDALEYALANNLIVTDEASALELSQMPVHIVQGRSDNIKITYSEDLEFAQLVLKSRSMIS